MGLWAHITSGSTPQRASNNNMSHTDQVFATLLLVTNVTSDCNCGFETAKGANEQTCLGIFDVYICGWQLHQRPRSYGG